MSNSAEFTHALKFKIPFHTAKQATIAQNSLNPDPILKPNELTVKYYTTSPTTTESNSRISATAAAAETAGKEVEVEKNTVLVIEFNGFDDRVIRVAANNVIENLKTVVECFENF
ncbi:unnamed protein product [Ambrosiozyma monospora]|uniref:Unnamed protein product n=1 Tax=Ambrosiozyma monospora TaxID=43982 RepID=A0A9W6YYI1_AMBMO|nr:unnamed protein product [Ambrosiozyma monospora]